MGYRITEIAAAISEMSRGAQEQVSKVDESSNLVEGILKSSNKMGEQAEHGKTSTNLRAALAALADS